MQLVRFFCYFYSLRPKYLLRHHFLEYPHPMFSLDVRPNFTSTQKKKQIYFSAYFNLHIHRLQTARKKKNSGPNGNRNCLNLISS